MGKTKKTKAAKFNKNDGTSRTFHLVSAPVLSEGGGGAKSFLQPFVPSNALKKENAQEQLNTQYDPIKGLEGTDVFGMDGEGEEEEKEEKADEDLEEGHVDEEAESYFPNDGYDYDQHLRPITTGGGGATFISADGSYGGLESVNKNQKIAHINQNINTNATVVSAPVVASSSFAVSSATASGPREEVMVYSGLGVPEEQIIHAKKEKRGNESDDEKLDVEEMAAMAGRLKGNENVREFVEDKEKKKREAQERIRVFKDEFSSDLRVRGGELDLQHGAGVDGEEEGAAELMEEMLAALDGGEEAGYEAFFPEDAEEEAEKEDDEEEDEEEEAGWDDFVSHLGGRLVQEGAPKTGGKKNRDQDALAAKDEMLWGAAGVDYVEMNRMERRKKEVMKGFAAMRGEGEELWTWDEEGEGEEGECDEGLYDEADQALQNPRGNTDTGKNLNEFRLQKMLDAEYNEEEVGGLDEHWHGDSDNEDVDEHHTVAPSMMSKAGARGEEQLKTLDAFDDLLDEFLAEGDTLKNYQERVHGKEEIKLDTTVDESLEGFSTPAREENEGGFKDERMLATVPSKTDRILLKTRQLELECGKEVSMQLLETMSDVGSDEEETEDGKKAAIRPLNDQDILKKFNLPLPKKEPEFDCETVLTTMSNISNHPGKIDVQNAMKKMREERKARHLEMMAKSGAEKKGNLLGGSNAEQPAHGLMPIAEGDEDESEEEEEDGEESGEEGGDGMPEVITVRPKGETKEEKKARKKAVKEYRRTCRANKKANTKMFKDEERKLQGLAAKLEGGFRHGSSLRAL